MTNEAAKAAVCRCELFIPCSILDGYACGRPDCWRTNEVKASFDGFVSDLVRKRDGGLPAAPSAAAQAAKPSA